MGVPLLFTEPGGGTPDLTVVPFPGLFLEDELFLSDDLYLDDGPTLQFYAEPPAVASFGVTVTVDPVAVTFSGGDAVLVGVEQVVVAVDAGVVTFDATAPSVAGQNVVVVVDGSSPVTFSATVPATSGGQLIILVSSVRELPPLRLSHSLETPSGRFFRWAEDEPNPANVPNGVRFSDTMPGGFETADAVLPRKPGTDYSDLQRLSTWKVLGAGGEPAGEYRLERAPRVSGDQMAISPSAVGWQAHLEDDKSAREIYVQRDLSVWGAIPSARLDALKAAGFQVTGSQSVVPGAESGVPRLELSFDRLDAQAGVRNNWVEAWYDTRGIPIGEIRYTYDDSEGVGAALLPALFATEWSSQLFMASTDVIAVGTTDTSADIAGGVGAGALTTTASNRTFAGVTLGYTGTFTGDGNWRSDWIELIVLGKHGLGLAFDSAGNGGYLASSVVAHAVGKWAPRLSFTTGLSGSIMPSAFVIPQLVFPDSTTAAEIVRGATRFGLQDWAVWDDKTFWWHDRGARGRKWRARISPAQLEETGPSLDRSWESVIVSYSDVDGSTKTVGPLGSGADTEDPVLKDNDPDNPANQAGIVRRDLLQMGTSTAAGAVEVGRQFLERSKDLDSSGRARFVGHVESDRGVLHPYHAPRAGDTVVFIDAADQSERRIVRTEKDHASRTCSVDLDAPPEALEALLERLGVVLVPLGFN